MGNLHKGKRVPKFDVLEMQGAVLVIRVMRNGTVEVFADPTIPGDWVKTALRHLADEDYDRPTDVEG